MRGNKHIFDVGGGGGNFNNPYERIFICTKTITKYTGI